MPGGRKLWAWLDTGIAPHVYVNDLVVHKCDLAVYPLGTSPYSGRPCGVCEMPAIRFGRTVVETPLCFYEHGYWQSKIFGVLPIASQETVLLGLKLVAEYAYVRFDNPARTVTLSSREPFVPEDPSQWVHLPFILKEIEGNQRMMVALPLGDQTIPVAFDTCGGKPGLKLSEAVWERVRHQLDARDQGRRKAKSHQFGWLTSRTYVLPTLEIGSMELSNAQIDVFPENSPLLRTLPGILSLHYFRKTSVVLDFQENLIWIHAEP